MEIATVDQCEAVLARQPFVPMILNQSLDLMILNEIGHKRSKFIPVDNIFRNFFHRICEEECISMTEARRRVAFIKCHAVDIVAKFERYRWIFLWNLS